MGAVSGLNLHRAGGRVSHPLPHTSPSKWFFISGKCSMLSQPALCGLLRQCSCNKRPLAYTVFWFWLVAIPSKRSITVIVRAWTPLCWVCIPLAGYPVGGMAVLLLRRAAVQQEVQEWLGAACWSPAPSWEEEMRNSFSPRDWPGLFLLVLEKIKTFQAECAL